MNEWFQQEMAAFDVLPPGVQDFMRTSAFGWQAKALAEDFFRFGLTEQQMLRFMIDKERDLMEQGCPTASKC